MLSWENSEGLTSSLKQNFLLPKFLGMLLAPPSPICLTDSPTPGLREEGRGSS